MDTIDKELKDLQSFDIPTSAPKIIKVIGVGGGGGNAVSHMFKEGIHDVSFVLCNTDNQALLESPVPLRIQLGKETTRGLGAGNKPERAKDATLNLVLPHKQIINYSRPF